MAHLAIDSMRSIRSRDSVFKWLIDNFPASYTVGIWVYGSFLTNSACAQDVDVLAIYRADRTIDAVQSRKRIERAFEENFGLPLHAIHLSEQEVLEEGDFLSTLLSAAHRLK